MREIVSFDRYKTLGSYRSFDVYQASGERGKWGRDSPLPSAID